METSATEDLHDGDCTWTALVLLDRITGFYRMVGGCSGTALVLLDRITGCNRIVILLRRLSRGF